MHTSTRARTASRMRTQWTRSLLLLLLSASTIFRGYKLHFRLGMVDSGIDVSQCSQLPPTCKASAASTKSLVSAILNKEEWGDAHLDELLEARKNTKPISAESIWKQKMWDKPLIESDKAVVSYSDPINIARLNAVTYPHAGDWLSTIPVRNCGLDLSNESIRVAIGLRLGLDLCTPHQCQCGKTADPGGHHGLVCRQSAGRSARHFAVNDLVWRALTKADTPCTKEPSGLIRTDGKRPDGDTLVPWARGKYIAWDVRRVRLPTSICRHGYQEGLRNMLRIGSVTSTPLSLLPTSLCRLRSRQWAPSTVRVASSCWNLVVVELWCPAIQERLFSCFNDSQYASSALTPSLIAAPSQRTPRTRKSLLDYITVI